MRYPSLFRRAAGYVAAGAIVVGTASCTMKSQEAPDLTGPSEFGQSITILADPDLLTQDGISRSRITVTVRGPNGEPIRGQGLLVETWFNGSRRDDIGQLSARQLSTGANGEASLFYTAPLGPALDTSEGYEIQIVATPIGTPGNAANTTARTASIRLVPVGHVVPPDGLNPAFSFTPTAPSANQSVLFQACATPCSPADNPIQRYEWDFGDGGHDEGTMVTHAYADAGTYNVTLTVVDFFGRRASTIQQVTVAQGALPTALFTFSPAQPAVGNTVSFNASGSTAAAGRTIVKYEWDFGTGAGFQTGNVVATHVFTTAATRTVTLRVTDDAGRQATTSQQVTIVP